MLSIANRKVWRSGVQHLRKYDPRLAKVIARVGEFEFEREGPHFEALVEAIVYQQIAGSAAQAILKRFKGLYNGNIPTPRQYLGTNIRKLRSAGLSPQKMSYIRDLCLRIQSGRLDLEKLADMEDEDVVGILDEVRGIGRWTAEMFLLFVLGRTDVLPVDDLGLRKAVQKTYRLRKLPSKDRMEELAVPWRPYSSIATLYLWRGLNAQEPAATMKIPA